MIKVSDEIWKTSARGRAELEVSGFDEKGKVSIDVEARWVFTQDGARSSVLWKGVGEVSTSIAREFAHAILQAADLADQGAQDGPVETA